MFIGQEEILCEEIVLTFWRFKRFGRKVDKKAFSESKKELEKIKHLGGMTKKSDVHSGVNGAAWTQLKPVPTWEPLWGELTFKLNLCP